MKKVLILCPFSYPSACGIWSRVYRDAKALISAGYEVHVFSSNIIKGTSKTSSDFEEFEGIKIHRFKSKFSLGGTSMFWFFGRSFSELSPDIVHTHGYRHPHSLFSNLLSKKKGIPIVLTSHGPFEKDDRRRFYLKLVDKVYDSIISRFEIKNYKKIVAISKWEIPYLKKLGGVEIELIPNSIGLEFFDQPIPENLNEIKNQVIYMGRVDSVKRLEWIQSAAKKLENVNFKIVGPVQNLNEEFENIRLKNLMFINKKYTSDEFIEEIDKSDIFILPSIRESFGIVLIEAMSRGKIVISSETKGALDLIENGVNGFLVQNVDELVEAIQYTYTHWEKLNDIRLNSISFSEKFREDKVNSKLISLYDKI